MRPHDRKNVSRDGDDFRADAVAGDERDSVALAGCRCGGALDAASRDDERLAAWNDRGF